MLPIYTFKSIWVQCAPLTSVASGLRLPFEATFVGYEPDTMGYRLWDNHTPSRHLRKSWDVTYGESISKSLQGGEPCPAPVSPAPLSVQAPYSQSSTRCA